MHIGNKGIQELEKFSLKEDGVDKLAGEIVAAKSYIIHEIVADSSKIDRLFVKCEISYRWYGWHYLVRE